MVYVQKILRCTLYGLIGSWFFSVQGGALIVPLEQAFSQQKKDRPLNQSMISVLVSQEVFQKVKNAPYHQKIKALVRIKESDTPDLYFDGIIEKVSPVLYRVYPPFTVPGKIKQTFAGQPTVVVSAFYIEPGLVTATTITFMGKKAIKEVKPKTVSYPMPSSIRIHFDKNAQKGIKQVLQGLRTRKQAKVFVSRPQRPKMFFHGVVEREEPGVLLVYPEQPMPTFGQWLKGRKGQAVYGYKITELDDETRVVPIVTPHHKGFFELGKRKGAHELNRPQKPAPSAPPLLQ